MTYETLLYQDAYLQVPTWLVPLWPMQRRMDQWLSFCGPSNGVGDEMVPDDYPDFHFACLCFIHDIDYATGPDTDQFFHEANRRLRGNMEAAVRAVVYEMHPFEREMKKIAGFLLADAYFEAVEIAGHDFFRPDPPGPPLTQPTVIKKLKRAGIRNPYLESAKEK